MTRHVISAPSKHNSYGASSFPAITDALFDIDSAPDQDAAWNEVKKQYSIVIFHVLSAANYLRPFVPEMSVWNTLILIVINVISVENKHNATNQK